jgi:collagen type III alpha
VKRPRLGEGADAVPQAEAALAERRGGGGELGAAVAVEVGGGEEVELAEYGAEGGGIEDCRVGHVLEDMSVGTHGVVLGEGVEGVAGGGEVAEAEGGGAAGEGEGGVVGEFGGAAVEGDEGFAGFEVLAGGDEAGDEAAEGGDLVGLVGGGEEGAGVGVDGGGGVVEFGGALEVGAGDGRGAAVVGVGGEGGDHALGLAGGGLDAGFGELLAELGEALVGAAFGVVAGDGAVEADAADDRQDGEGHGGEQLEGEATSAGALGLGVAGEFGEQVGERGPAQGGVLGEAAEDQGLQPGGGGGLGGRGRGLAVLDRVGEGGEVVAAEGADAVEGLVEGDAEGELCLEARSTLALIQFFSRAGSRLPLFSKADVAPYGALWKPDRRSIAPMMAAGARCM